MVAKVTVVTGGGKARRLPKFGALWNEVEGKVMNQSAIRSLCSCVVLVVVAAQVHAGTSLSGNATTAVRELELSIHQRGVEAHKVVQQDAIKHVMSKAVLVAQLQASLNLQPTLAMVDVNAAREPLNRELGVEPSAD